VAEGVDRGRRPELIGGGLIRSAGGWSAIKALRNVDMRTMGDERILGGGDFVQSVLTHAKGHYEKKTLALVRGLKLQTLIETVAEKLGLVPTDVWSTIK
jgi:putative transposase